MQAILEEALPCRIGRHGFHYQLAEEDDGNGSTRFVLRVSPEVGPIAEEAVRAAFIEEIGRYGPVDQYHVEMLRQVGAVEIRREAPIAPCSPGRTSGVDLPATRTTTTR
jgi:hypothetical protein